MRARQGGGESRKVELEDQERNLHYEEGKIRTKKIATRLKTKTVMQKGVKKGVLKETNGGPATFARDLGGGEPSKKRTFFSPIKSNN